MSFERVAILGCGLMGGSFALGLRAAGFAGERVGWDREETLEKAKRRSAIDHGTTELDEAIAGADLIYLATPVTLILELLPAVGRTTKRGALVTDAGSTKVHICRRAGEALPEGVFFLGGHPLTGKEVGGIENATPELFAKSKYVVVRDGKTESSPSLGITTEFLEWVRKLRAEPVEMDAETHDWAVALVSHLPQLVSTALASTVWDETDEDGLPLTLAAGGFRDMMRLAGSPYDIWRDIGLTNGENIERALERLAQALERVRTNLRSKELAEEFAKAQQTCQVLRTTAGRKNDE